MRVFWIVPQQVLFQETQLFSLTGNKGGGGGGKRSRLSSKKVLHSNLDSPMLTLLRLLVL